MTIKVLCRSGGEHCVSRLIMSSIVDEMPEFTWGSSRVEAVNRILDSIENEDRIEVTSWSPEGNLEGVMILRADDDDHVGECLSVQWRFVLKGSRGIVGVRLQRELVSIARTNGFRVIAYTKSIGVGRYELTYKQLKEKPNG